MSTTFIDPPGPLTNTYEPIDFTTDYLVTSISIEFNPSRANGPRETVWDGTSDDSGNTGGDFSYLYRASTHSDLSGSAPYHWTIQREGAWPADFRIRVKEATPAAVDGGAWTVMYEKDLRTLSNQSISVSAGEYRQFTLDGNPWAYHGGGTGNSLSLVNGSGLCLIAGDSRTGGLPYGGTLAMARVYAWAGLDLTKEIAVQFRISGSYQSGAEVGCATYSGPETYGLGSNGAPVLRSTLAVGPATTTMAQDNGSTLPIISSSTVMDDWVFAVTAAPYVVTPIHTYDNLRTYWWRNFPGSTLPSMQQMRVGGCRNGIGTGENTHWHLGAYLGSSGGSKTMYVTNIRVLQRSV